MDLPDFDKAAHAAEALTTNHRGQHRCTDSIYYGPRDAEQGCPVSRAVQVLCDTIDQTKALPHDACHDPEAVRSVAQAMCLHPNGDQVPLVSLDPEQAAWWIDTARLAMEAQAALLDPAVQS